jgi:hypothetical protein
MAAGSMAYAASKFMIISPDEQPDKALLWTSGGVRTLKAIFILLLSSLNRI